MISYRHPHQALWNAQLTPFVRYNYAGIADLEEITTRKRKFSSDKGSDLVKSEYVNPKTKVAQICNVSKQSEPVVKVNTDKRKKKTTLFTIAAILGHSTEESPRKKRKLQLTHPTNRKDDSIDSGFSSSGENDESIVVSTNDDSGICLNDSNEQRQAPGKFQSAQSQLYQPKIENIRPPLESFNHMYMPVNGVQYFYQSFNRFRQQNSMPKHQHAISYAPMQAIAFVDQEIRPISTTSRSQKAESSKRTRTTFTQKQLERLEIEFSNHQYMVGIERRELAKKLRLTDAQVKVWFQNRRIRYRNEKKREPEEETKKLDILKREASREP
uniref:homeobox protein Hox-D3-like n=1 Tax=Styela clava TaxID=7725 RepID=UPI00193A93A3|nr:homeobox protein Hox-D3-like [Styela clava]